MSDNLVIREGRKEDCEEIAKLIEGLARSENYSEWMDDVESLYKDGFGEFPWFHTFLAEEKSDKGNSKLTGFTLYNYCYSMLDGRCVHMESLYVDPEHRGKGIGTKLWKAIAKTAISKGCNLMEIGILEKNVKAKEYYMRYGTIDLTAEFGVHILAMHRPQLQKLAED